MQSISESASSGLSPLLNSEIQVFAMITDENAMANSAFKIAVQAPCSSGRLLAPPQGRRIDFLSSLFLFAKGPLIPVGVGLFFLGLVISFSVLSKTTFNPWRWSEKTTTQVQGKVLNTWGVEKMWGQTVYGHIFQYQLSSGEVVRGISYSLEDRYKKGQGTPVQYVKNRPRDARLLNTWTTSGGYRDLSILGIPLIGLLFFMGGIKQGYKHWRLLKYSTIELAFLIAKEKVEEKNSKADNVHELRAPLYLLTYFYETPEGKKFQFQWHSRERLETDNDPSAPIVFDPEDPLHPQLVSTLGTDIHFSEDGSQLRAGIGLNIISLMMVAVVYSVLLWKLMVDFWNQL